MLCFVMALVLQAPPTAPATSPTVELPAEIRKSLLHSAEQIGPISVAFTVQSSSPFTAEEAKEKFKLDDWYAAFNANARTESKLSWQAGKYRSWFCDAGWPGKPEHAADQVLEGAFDGDTIYLGSLDIMLKGAGDLNRDVLFKVPLEVTPTPHYALENRGWTHGTYYFDRAGWRMPVSIGELKESRPPQSQLLYMLSQGAKVNAVTQDEIEGQKLVGVQLIAEDPDRKRAEATDPQEMIDKLRRMGALETDEQLQMRADAILKERQLPKFRLYIFYLDPSRSYALRRYEERYEDGTRLRRTDCEALERVARRDLYLPRRCIDMDYTLPQLPGRFFPHPVVTLTYEISEIKLEPIADEKFALSYTNPNTEIIEIVDSNDARREFIVQENGLVRERGR